MYFSFPLRNARAAATEVAVGPSPLIQFFNGTIPTYCADPDAGTLIAQGTLPVDWMQPPFNGRTDAKGVWYATGLPAAGSGTLIKYFRIKNAAGTICHMQGTVAPFTKTDVRNGLHSDSDMWAYDLVMDTLNIANGQLLVWRNFLLADSNIELDFDGWPA